MKIAVAKKSPQPTDREKELALKLGLPLIDLPDSSSSSAYDYFFSYNEFKLTLASASAEAELSVDFADAKLSYRVQGSIKNQGIAKAVGVRGGQRPSVLDATAGLGKDAFLLASFGCRVLLLERSMLVHALLVDGLERADYYSVDTAKTLTRMSLRLGEFVEFSQDTQSFDVVYLDPMFPPRRKSAKVKKDMALLQELLGHQSGGSELLAHAKCLAKKRVVVKRAKSSPYLGADAPDIEFKGSSSRYDVYLITP